MRVQLGLVRVVVDWLLVGVVVNWCFGAWVDILLGCV